MSIQPFNQSDTEPVAADIGEHPQSKVLESALNKKQSFFNSQFHLARRTKPKLDGELFKHHLRNTIAPIVEAVHAVRPDRVDDVVEVLFMLSLDLMGGDLLGPSSRYDAIQESWDKLLPAVAHLIAPEPRLMVSAITNAIYNIAITDGGNHELWINNMIQISKLSDDVQTMLEAGKVVAWRCGLAHYRQGALESLLKLPSKMALAALGISADNSESVAVLHDRLCKDPWFRPGPATTSIDQRSLEIAGRVGAFRGFGGMFRLPPKVFRQDERFHVTDGEECWVLCADIFGTTLQRTNLNDAFKQVAITSGDNETAAKRFAIEPNGTVTCGSQSARFAELAGVASHAANDTTLALTKSLSHAVYLVALL